MTICELYFILSCSLLAPSLLFHLKGLLELQIFIFLYLILFATLLSLHLSLFMFYFHPSSLSLFSLPLLSPSSLSLFSLPLLSPSSLSLSSLPLLSPSPLSLSSLFSLSLSSLSQETTLQHILQTSDVHMTEMEGWAGLPQDLQQELQMLVAATVDPSFNHEPSLLHQHDSYLNHRHTDVSSRLGRESEVGILESSSDQVLRLYAPPPPPHTHTHRLTQAVTAVRAVTVESGRQGKFPLIRTPHCMQWTPWHLTVP